MKHYYYFVRDLAKATPDSFVYHVSVGSSDREFTKLCLVQEYCKDCGLYFHRVDDVSDTAIRNLEKRLFPGTKLFISPMKRASVSISDLYDMIVEDSFTLFEKSYTEKRGFFRFKCLLDNEFYAKQNKKKNPRTLPCPSRKYLKSGSDADWNSFLIGSALNLILFLMAAWLEGRFGM